MNPSEDNSPGEHKENKINRKGGEGIDDTSFPADIQNRAKKHKLSMTPPEDLNSSKLESKNNEISGHSQKDFRVPLLKKDQW